MNQITVKCPACRELVGIKVTDKVKEDLILAIKDLLFCCNNSAAVEFGSIDDLRRTGRAQWADAISFAESAIAKATAEQNTSRF